MKINQLQTRRSFLKTSAIGAGALAFGPSFGELFAETVQDGVKGAMPSVLGGTPRRFVFIRKSNGIRPHELGLPTFTEQEKKLDHDKQPLEVDLDKHELPEWLNALAPYKQNLTILQGLSAKMSENGHGSWSSVMGAYKSGRNSLSGIKRATIDFELAKLFPSPYGHVELALRGNFQPGILPGYSAPAPHQRNYCYADPMTAYDELFRSVLNPQAVDSDNAMLAYLENEERFKASVLQGYERQKLDSLVESVESIQARNERLSSKAGEIKQYMPTIGAVHGDGGPDASSPEKQQAMTDILVAALASGLTNVVTYTIDELSTPVRGLPGNESDAISIHQVGHGGSYSGVNAEKIREKIRIGHMDQVKAIADKLKAIPEGKGSMFDNTLIMYFPENGETHHSSGVEAPFVVVAGDNCVLDMLGRYIRLPYHATEGHKTLGNWYTTLLNAHGNPIEHYGDFDQEMARKKLDQAGAIERFLS